MEPTQDRNHVVEGLNLLIGQYRGLPNIAGMLTAFLNRIQDIEDTLWDVIRSQLLTTPPTGQALYQIADLVQAPKGDFNDAELLIFVLVWIQAHKSGGRPEDLLTVLRLVLPTPNYQEFYPAAFEIWSLNVPPQNGATPPEIVSALSQALRIAKPAGVDGVFVWSDWSVPTTFWFKDSTGSDPGSGLQDSVSEAYPQGLCSAIQL